MLRTALCDLMGITMPIIQAGMGPWASAELAAAVSNAGGLGSFGAGTRSPESLASQLTRLRQLTD
jgi:enoyl-[acyl-carrier protein] reductase II